MPTAKKAAVKAAPQPNPFAQAVAANELKGGTGCRICRLLKALTPTWRARVIEVMDSSVKEFSHASVARTLNEKFQEEIAATCDDRRNEVPSVSKTMVENHRNAQHKI